MRTSLVHCRPRERLCACMLACIHVSVAGLNCPPHAPSHFVHSLSCLRCVGYSMIKISEFPTASCQVEMRRQLLGVHLWEKGGGHTATTESWHPRAGYGLGAAGYELRSQWLHNFSKSFSKQIMLFRVLSAVSMHSQCNIMCLD